MPPTIADFDYDLPPELIAQQPPSRRDGARLMVVDRARRSWRHLNFADLPDILDPDHLLVLNDTRVFPARLTGRKASGGRVELLLHHLPASSGEASAPAGIRVRASYRGRLRPGQVVHLGPNLAGEIMALLGDGVAEVLFPGGEEEVRRAILAQGEVPLPPYIRRPAGAEDRERYQTVYAAQAGAIAAPTAGLHFTPEVLAKLRQLGVDTATITLHVGPGTFLPVRAEDYTRHRLLPEYFVMPAAAATCLNRARAAGKRLTAVGTTSVRVLEHCAGSQGFTPQEGWCGLYIYPGYRFRAVDRLLTNFHLPRSTLLLLVAAFAGRDLVLAAYQEASRRGYRFYSYGDCMLLL